MLSYKKYEWTLSVFLCIRAEANCPNNWKSRLFNVIDLRIPVMCSKFFTNIAFHRTTFSSCIESYTSTTYTSVVIIKMKGQYCLLPCIT